MTSYIVAVHLVVEAGATDPRAEIAAQLDAILGQNLGTPSPLLDWAVAGDDLAESIAPVALPVDYRPDESAFPSGLYPSDCSYANFLYNAENTDGADMQTKSVSTAEFIRHFGRYHDEAQRAPLTLTKHGRASVVVLSAEIFERLIAQDDPRRAYAAGETPPELAEILLSGLDRQSAQFEAGKE